jgi:hypothetical protein
MLSDLAWKAIFSATWKALILGFAMGVLACLPAILLAISYLREKRRLEARIEHVNMNLLKSLEILAMADRAEIHVETGKAIGEAALKTFMDTPFARMSRGVLDGGRAWPKPVPPAGRTIREDREPPRVKPA